jgi:hypothetical protein
MIQCDRNMILLESYLVQKIIIENSLIFQTTTQNIIM